MKQLIKKINPKLLLKIITLIGIIILYFGRGLNDFRAVPYIEGDGFEYVLMTEALYNHASPDIRISDIETFNIQIKKHYDYNSFPKREYIDALEAGLKKAKERPFMECYNGIYNAKSNKVYSYHFFTYSLFSVIGKTFCMLFNFPPLTAFHLSNALLVVIVSFLLLFVFSNNYIISVFSALCFSFGNNYWYLGWEHTEIFTTCFVAMGLIYYLKNKHFTGLLLLAIATSQNQPLIILLGLLMLFTFIKYILDKQITVKKIIYFGLIGLLAISPMMFYYYNFNTTNLIKDLGFLDNIYITPNRVTGFFFDLNQGMILALPLILPCYIVIMIITVFKKNITISNKILNALLILSIILIAITVSTMRGWNAGQAIVNRYTTWTAAIVFIHLFYLLDEYSDVLKIFLLNNFLATQLFVCFYFQEFNKFDWEFFQHKHIVDWVFGNHADMYNPDPQIFSTRTIGELDVINVTNPIFYFDSNNKLRKVMFNHKNMDVLEKYFVKKSNFIKIKEYASNYNWSYLKEGDLKKLIPHDKIYTEIRNARMLFHKNRLLSDPTFLRDLPIRINTMNKTKEEILEFDAFFYTSEEERSRNS